MSTLFFVIVGIALVFSGLLVLKQKVFRLNVCAICLAVSITWFALMVLLWLNMFQDKTIIAVLVGQSSLGMYYLLEKRVAKQLLVYRLPFLLSLIAISYSAISQTVHIDAFAAVALSWLVTGFLYAYRRNPVFRGKTRSLIECCSNW